MNNTLITIVVPVYNTDLDKLERCLKSIPDHSNVRVRIYDDCSTKYNAEFEISRIINNNSSLSHLYKEGNKFIRLNSNKGLGFVRNQSIKDLYDESEYVIFLDSDDEVSLSEDEINKILSDSNKGILARFYNIELISDSKVSIEGYNKYLGQKMIPYFITPAVYNVRYLSDNNILFDESRRTFEDIQFSVKLWTNIISSCTDYNKLISISDNTVIYKYHLEGESLTRNDNLNKMSDDLYYWINWIKLYYNDLHESSKESIKPYLFNRIRYESLKIMSMKMKVNNDLYKYSDLVDMMKPYNIDNVMTNTF